LSAGTNFSADDDMMKDHTPKCLLCLVERRADGGEERAALADNAVSYGVCILDPSTASFEVGSFGEDMYQTRLGTLLSQLQPAEILFAAQSLGADTKTTIDRESDKALMSPQPPSEAWDAQRTLRELASGGYFRDKEDDAMETEGDDSEGAWPRVIGEFAARVRGAEAEEGDPHADLALRALGACVKYLQAQLIDQEMVALQNFHRFLPYDAAGSGASAAATEEGAERARAPAQLRSVRGARRMVLDTNSIANLELLENEQGLKQHSLLAFLDRCSTNSGKRLLKKWLLSPLYHKDEIDRRLDAVEELLGLGEVIEQAVAPLRKLPDFERLLGRVHANARRDPAHPMNRAIIYVGAAVTLPAACVPLAAHALPDSLTFSLRW
jgi:DNA mismatch repair protein MSH6